MNLLAAATQPAQPAPYQASPYQAQQQYPAATMQPDRPVQQPNWKAKFLGYSYLLFNVAVVVFVIVMIYRFVRAFERIAGGLEKGIVIKKDDTTTT